MLHTYEGLYVAFGIGGSGGSGLRSYLQCDNDGNRCMEAQGAVRSICMRVGRFGDGSLSVRNRNR